MMKKFIRVLEIILLVFAIVCGVLLLIGYLVDKEYTISVLNSIKDFANQPLPIVGVSIITFGVFAYEIFVKTNFGAKAISQVKEHAKNEMDRLEEKETELHRLEDEVEKHLKEQDVSIDELKGYVIELCGYNRNIKAQELANKIGGANNEEIDRNTEEE